MRAFNPKEFKVVALPECPLPESLRNEPRRSVRVLKIEAEGVAWKRPLKPKLRLTGRWLERAGFKPGDYVRITCVAHGIMEMRSPDASLSNETKQSSLIR